MSPVVAEAECVPQSIPTPSRLRWRDNPRMWFSPAWFRDWKDSMKSSWQVWRYTKREASIYLFSSICSDSKYAIAAAAYWLNSVGFFTWGKTVILKVASWVAAAVTTAAAILQNAA